MADRWNGVTLVVNLVLPVQCVSLRPGSTALSRERERDNDISLLLHLSSCSFTSSSCVDYVENKEGLITSPAASLWHKIASSYFSFATNWSAFRP